MPQKRMPSNVATVNAFLYAKMEAYVAKAAIAAKRATVICFVVKPVFEVVIISNLAGR